MLTVQRLRNRFKRLSLGGHFKDAPNNRRLALVDRQLLSGRASHRNRVVAEAAPASVLASQHQTFQSAMGLLGKFLHIQAVHHAVDGDQHMRLLVLGIDSLTDGDETDAREIQLLEDAQCILGVSRKTAAVVEQNDIEGATRRERRVQKASETGPVGADAAQRLIAVDMLFEKQEPASLSVLAANPKLVLNRAGTLKIAGIASVSGATQNHD